MTKIKKLTITNSGSENCYDISIINEGTMGTSTLLNKKPIDSFGIIDLVYSLPSSSNAGNIFNWGTHNIDFSPYYPNDVTNILLADDPSPKKAHIAIKDTDFPPPKGFLNITSVGDIYNLFSITKIEITRDVANKAIAVIEVSSTNGTSYKTQNPSYRHQTVDGAVMGILLYPIQDSTGDTSLTFTVTNIDIPTMDKNGVPIFIVYGDSSIPAQLPSSIKKKAHFWLEA